MQQCFIKIEMKVVYQYINAHIASHTALGRVGLPTDISPVVAFLCTEEAYWVNAQRMRFRVGRRSGIVN